MPWQERGTDISAWPTQKVSSSLGNKSNHDRNSWNLIVMSGICIYFCQWDDDIVSVGGLFDSKQ